MFKNLSIKMKLLATVIGAILTVALVIEINSIYSMKKEANIIISDTEKLIYKAKEEEVKNYVSLAYKTIETYHAKTSKEKIQISVEKYLKEQTEYLFSIINSEYEKNKDLMTEEELFKRIKDIIIMVKHYLLNYLWLI